MIDTVIYKCFLALLYPGSWPRGWRGWKPIVGGDTVPDEDYAMQNDLLGLRVFVHAGVIIKVEADLPKLLYGHNGRLLKCQDDIDAALERLKLALETVSRPHGMRSGYYPGDRADDFSTYYIRVDLAWQFDLKPGVVFLAMRNAKHPEINKRNGEYRDQTLVFPGTDIRICMYDKKAKAKASCSHNVLRVEIQLRDHKIAEHFGLEEHELQILSFDTAYGVYRNTLSRFGSDLIPDQSGKGTIEDFLAWTVVKLCNDDPVGVYCATKKLSRRCTQALRKRVGQRVPTLMNHSWSRLLPEAQLPPVVEIGNPVKEAQVNGFFDDIERWMPARAA